MEQPDASHGFVNKITEHAKHVTSSLTSPYSWNVFRYIGDYVHLFGVAVLLFTLARNKNCKGFSMKTAMLYAMIFICRYLDLFVRDQTTYLVVFKLTYIATSLLALLSFYVWYGTYEHHKDTCAIVVLVFGCFCAALIITPLWTVLEVFWSFSQFLEGFALVPQYVFCYRDPDNKDWGVKLFVVSIGLYRVFYAFNWIYKKANIPSYSDLQSWIGGVFEILFFVDYCLHQFHGFSVLKSAVLNVDEKVRTVSDKIEFKVFGTSSALRAEAEGLRRRNNQFDELESLEV